MAAIEHRFPVGRTAIGYFGLTTDNHAVTDDFGEVMTGRDFVAWAEAADERRGRDRAFVEAGRTWLTDPYRRVAHGPVTPAEVPAKRYLVTGGLSNFLSALLRNVGRYPSGGEAYAAAGVAHQVVWAAVEAGVNFLIPAEALGALEQHEALDEELRQDLRLPYEAVNVWFAEPLVIDHEDLTADQMHGDRDQADGEDAVEFLDPTDWVAQLAAMGVADRVLVDGVQLRADGQGRIADPFLWFTRVEASFGMAATAVPARRSASAAAPFLDLVDATVAWGRWDEGADMTAAVADKELRRELTKGTLRKVARSGKLNPGVRVLDLRRSTTPRRPGVTGERTVSAHLRRGHWRRVRCGPRADWHYEYRWVLPTVVGGSAAADPNRVYRLRLPTQTNVAAGDLDETTGA